MLNLQLAWVLILVGLLTGVPIGLCFHREDWLGGYGSWRRRLVRLGHIALFGTGLLNVAFALSVDALELAPSLRVASVLLAVGAVSMPVVCFLSAWRPTFRHLFFVPVVSLIGGVVDFIWRGLMS